jgi:hypothetical protein
MRAGFDWTFHKSRWANGGNAANGTLLPRANAAACSQLAKADFASSSQHVRERQRIAALDAEADAPPLGRGAGRCFYLD